MNAQPTNPPVQPGISTPKGGGAIRGINEQFQANSFTGAAGFSIPVPVTAARGFEPSLAVAYNSGSGNGSCGMGATLSITGITRKTSNGIPKYDDTDVYLLQGAELVPALSFNEKTAAWVPVVRTQQNWQITTYRPRTEGSFALIERWQDTEGYDSYWSVTSGDNQQTVYGKSAAARIADPEQPRRIFCWMPETAADDKGNLIEYQYEPDERDNNTYLKSVAYGNYTANGAVCFAFTVVIDYGTFDPATPDIIPAGYVPRPDPFSTFISGFEIRHSRLVAHALLYHQFTDQYGGQPFLTRSLDLHYGDTDNAAVSFSGLSFLRRIGLTGYQKQDDGTYAVQTMPPLDLTYTGFAPAAQQYRTLQVEDNGSAPGYLTPDAYQLVDLDNEGLPGMLYSNGLTSFYYAPLGEGRYKAPVALEGFPVQRDLGDGQHALLSLAGNGIKELVVEHEGRSGYYSNLAPGQWSGFVPFAAQTTELFSGKKQWADLTGNGLADLVLFEPDTVKYYPSLRTQGYGAATRALLRPGFPATENNHEEELLTFAAMLGDGLQHYVRIRNGSVECWPNMGYGRFGAMRTMRNAPRFGEYLDAGRLRLADLDGSGTADIIYLEHRHASIWFNQSGNGFSDPVTIPLPVSYDQLSQISFADINGTGTTCMIVTVTEPEVCHYYYDFAAGGKPYLLRTMKNNIGAASTYRYTTSVRQFLRDKRNGRPWPTRLFFPVQVIEAVELTDEPSGAFHIQHFTYHDGYYDPEERTFRGFGYTESLDTDHYSAYAASAGHSGFPVSTVNEALHVAPVLTKSWYHTGCYAEAGRTAGFYREAFYDGDPDFYSISGQALGPGIADADAETLRQAYAAMEGQLLRQEVYGLDGSAAMHDPYTVTETEVCIRLVQPRLQQRYAVFLPYVRQSMSWQYERNPQDPRVTHSFSLLVSEYGAVTQSCQVCYPRRSGAGWFVFDEQKELKITLTSNDVTTDIQSGSRYINVPAESRSYEIADVTPAAAYFSFEEMAQGILQALQTVVDYQSPFAPGGTTPQARIYHREQHYYWSSDQQRSLAPGRISTPLLPHHSETAVYPKAAFDDCYSGLLDAADISNDTGYIVHDGYYWNAGLTRYFLPAGQYYLPYKQQNDFAPADNISLQPVTTTDYDTYLLRPISTTQALSGAADLTVTSVIDYRTMQAWSVTDANANVSEVLFDPLGYVIVTTSYGQTGGQATGNQPLSDYQVLPATAGKVIADPQQYLQGAGSYFFYDLFAWMDRGMPVSAVALQAQLYASQVKDDQENLVRTGIVFSDGFGRPLESKTNTAPGSTGVRDRDGNWVYHSVKGARNWSDDRWICTGRTVYNNKGNPAQQFQPYFSNGWTYVPTDTLIGQHRLTPPTVLHYDALDRVVRTDSPKGFFSRTSFTAWDSRQFDANDTILDAPYYQQHKDQINELKQKHPDAGAQLPGTEIAAIRQAIACYNSPAAQVLDTMGRVTRSMTDKLGAVTANKLMPVLQDAAAVQQAIGDLIAAGWLVADTGNADVYWLTAAFQPYTIGFAGAFTIGGDLSAELLDLLRQGRLTTLQQYDAQGRVLQATDPRLLWSDLTAGTDYYNFRYQYLMPGGLIKTLSADAGPRTQLLNIFSGNVHFWDARGFRTDTVYDQLQRNIQTVVSGGNGKDSRPHTVARTIFGDYAPDAAAHNLIGQPWKTFDDAGLTFTALYDLQGKPLAQERYFRACYKTMAHWNEATEAAIWNEPPFRQWTEHNALGLAIRCIYPDGSIYLPAYNIAGQVAGISVVFEPEADKEPQALLRSAGYDPGGRPVYLEYGNGTAIHTVTEATTQQVINQRSYRMGTPQKGTDPRLQEIHYTYDPVGNITARRDNSWEHVFSSNQQVSPLSRYEYDLIYQLIQAGGRQLKQGAQAAGAARQFMQAHGIPLRSANPSDQQALENYTRQYTYDDAGNLTGVRHQAAVQQTLAYTVAPGSNRLSAAQKPQTYDANGNLETLDHLASVTWNYCNQLTAAVAVARTDADPDAEYYQYDAAGSRVRKVTERLMHGGTKKEIEEKYYLGPYQYKKITVVTVGAADGKPAVLLEKQSLKLSGPAGLCCVTHSWTRDTTGRETRDRKRVYRYQYGDVLDSVGLETDDAGAVLTYEEYYPYGGTAFTVAANVLEISSKEYRYSGQEKDGFTGLYYYGMRYYPPWLCRWMNADPAGTVDGLNLYAFVGGNPVTHKDIGGLMISTFKYFGKDKPKPPTNDQIERRATALGKKIAEEANAEGASFATNILKIATSASYAPDGERTLLDENNDVQDDSRFDAAYAHALRSTSSKKSDKNNEDAAAGYRMTHDAQDEHVATSVICSLIRGVASAGALPGDVHQEIKEAFRFVSRFRLPTADTGVKTADGTMQHPTAVDLAVYGEDKKDGSREHIYWNRQRAHLTLQAGENSEETGIGRLLAMAFDALGYTLVSAYARPTAANVIPRQQFTPAELLDKSKNREKAKRLYHELGANDNTPVPKRAKGSDPQMQADYHFNWEGSNMPSPMYHF